MREEEVASIAAKPLLAGLGSPSPLSCVPPLASGSPLCFCCNSPLSWTYTYLEAAWSDHWQRSSAGEGYHTAPHLLQTLLSHLAQAIADYVVFQVESGLTAYKYLILGVDNYHLICGNAGQSLISKRL